jgi:hypothetical protein
MEDAAQSWIVSSQYSIGLHCFAVVNDYRHLVLDGDFQVARETPAAAHHAVRRDIEDVSRRRSSRADFATATTPFCDKSVCNSREDWDEYSCAFCGCTPAVLHICMPRELAIPACSNARCADPKVSAMLRKCVTRAALRAFEYSVEVGRELFAGEVTVRIEKHG